MRWSKRLDVIAIWILALPTLVLVQYFVGLPFGPPAGFALAIVVWLIYRAIKFTVVIIVVKSQRRFRCEGETSAIFNDAQATGDFQSAIARLEDLMAREGETNARLLALSGQHIELRDYAKALQILYKVESQTPEHELCLIEISKAHCLRELGRLDEGYEIIQRVALEYDYVHQAHTEHAKHLAELERCDEAWAAFARAKRRYHRLSMFLVGGRSLVKLIDRELRECEQFVAERCPPRNQ